MERGSGEYGEGSRQYREREWFSMRRGVVSMERGSGKMVRGSGQYGEREW